MPEPLRRALDESPRRHLRLVDPQGPPRPADPPPRVELHAQQRRMVIASLLRRPEPAGRDERRAA
jgi:hypothetical protein